MSVILIINTLIVPLLIKAAIVSCYLTKSLYFDGVLITAPERVVFNFSGGG